MQKTEDARTGATVGAAVAALDSVDDVEPLHWDEIRDAMRDVVVDLRGTAHTAMGDAEYSVAGKTGTAQVVGVAQDEEYDAEAIDEIYRDNALFIAYAPIENPEIAIAVVVENVAKGGGGSNAAPIARKVLDAYFGPDSEVDYVAQLVSF